MKKYKIGFIGCGNMAQAIIKSLTSDTVVSILKDNGLRFEIRAADTAGVKLDAFPSGTVAACASNGELVEGSDIVFLSIKPQTAAEALQGLSLKEKIVISIMAGVNLGRLSALTGARRLVRVMPNLNARIGSSFNAYCPQGLDGEEEDVVVNILSAFGETARVREDQMNAITGITGSGPAYVFLFIKAFMDTAIKAGFDRAAAKKMALAAVVGSAYNVESCDYDPGDMVDAVCSKGGTTIEGVSFLKEKAFTETVEEAIERAIRRSEEMEKQA